MNFARALLLPALLAAAACTPAPEPRALTLTFPGAAGSAQPRLTADPDGRPILSWLEADDDAHVLRYARFESGEFGTPQQVVRSERMFVNWADFPSVTAITDDLWFAHWLRLQSGSYAYDIATAMSHDGGRTWSEAEPMNEDETEAEHGFVSVFADGSHTAAFWLDGRELAEWSFDEPDKLLGVSLRLAYYDDDGHVTGRSMTDNLVCDCCQPDTAIADAGPVVVYRDRTEQDIRDVVLRRYVDGAWAPPVNLGNEGWYLEGCPVNGPTVAASGAELAVAWFTAADSQARVRLVQSHDAGASFSPVIDVDGRGSLGQTGVVVDDEGRAIVSWWRRGQMGGIDLMVRAYSSEGTPDAEVVVAHEDIGQAINVPQLIGVDDDFLIAWTTLDGDGSVRLARLEL